jgi:hypothetical protein
MAAALPGKRIREPYYHRTVAKDQPGKYRRMNHQDDRKDGYCFGDPDRLICAVSLSALPLAALIAGAEEKTNGRASRWY